MDVIEADIKASNGIIHAVDQVLLAPQADIVGTLVGDDRFSTLVAAVTAAGLVDTLRGGMSRECCVFLLRRDCVIWCSLWVYLG